MQVQHDKDIANAQTLSKAFSVEINPYDNTLISKALVEVVAAWFDNYEVAKKEIFHFMYELDFGRKSEKPNDIYKLWGKLIALEETNDPPLLGMNFLNESDVFGNQLTKNID